ncbi:hypothetical protein PHLCEN_2v5464 [Hermanssonia centrifuga]|uniref:Uncharacterized protein n=1 Tax=Hermanssonia centrifuga TaxID=98765 RepID=A0A2R6P2D3_9APHY|nr:hypothetical protein PHLCEN_2v5464 [Hermanssonia centrifuga]
MNIAQVIVTIVPILIGRFLLNLRQLGETQSWNDTQDESRSRLSSHGVRLTTLASIIGNMGEDLDHGPSEDEDEERDDSGLPMEVIASESPTV